MARTISSAGLGDIHVKYTQINRGTEIREGGPGAVELSPSLQAGIKHRQVLPEFSDSAILS